MPGKKKLRKNVTKVVDSSDSEAEVEVTKKKKTKSKRDSNSSSTDTSNTTKRSKHESDQEGKEKRLRAEIERLREKKADIEFGRGKFAAISSEEKQYQMNECKTDIAENKQLLKELINPRSTTPTKDPVFIVSDALAAVDRDLLVERLQHPHVLLKSLGWKYEYQTSDGFNKSLYGAFATNYEAYTLGTRDKNICGIPFIASGIGDGKSRALSEIPSLLQRRFNLQSTTFCVSFENGTGSAVPSPSEHIPLRILHHLLGGSSFETFVAQYIGKSLTLETILTVLRDMGLLKPTVLLMIDGIHNIDRSDLVHNPMRVLLREVVLDYIHSINDTFVFPVCSCTASIEVIQALQGSTTKKHWITLPRLSSIPKIKGKDISITPQQFAVMGGHGRSVEILQEVLESNLEQPLSDIDLYKAVVGDMKQNRSGFSTFNKQEVAKLLKDSFLRTEYKIKEEDATVELEGLPDNHISRFLRHGLLSVTDDCLQIAPIWLLLNCKQEDGHILQGWPGPTTNSDREWEMFGAWFRMFLSKVHPEEAISLTDFHKGMLWADGFDPPTFKNVAISRILKGRHHISTKSHFKAGQIKQSRSPGEKATLSEQMGTWVVDQVNIEDGKVIVLNGEKAPAGDVFVPLKCDGSVFNEVQQQKLYIRGKLPVNPEEFGLFADKELSKSVGDDDVMLLFTQAEFPGHWKDTLRGKRVGVVHRSNFEQYFGPFAAFWL